MSKLWLSLRRHLWLLLGLLSFGLALFGYLHQELMLGVSWDWSQLWHHEPLVGIAVCVGVTLVIVGLINKGEQNG